MNCVRQSSLASASVAFYYTPRNSFNMFNSDYRVDMWREVQRRWMVLGVLLAVMLAVLSPRVGAPGGKEPACSLIDHSRTHCTQSAIAMLSSVGGGCAWLSLSLCGNSAAATLTALNYVVSLFATPLAMIFFCGRATVPPLGGILSTLLTTLPPYAAGALRPRARRESVAPKLSALLLLYADCCGRLRDAEGSLYVGDVLVTISLELCWLAMSMGACWAYARTGLLGARDAHTVAMCAVPRALHTGWESSTSCNPSGMSRLPAVFLSPAQALFLAAIAHEDDDDLEGSTDDKETDETLTSID